MSEREVWFLTGSQELYGEDALRQVADQSEKIAARLEEGLPIAIKWLPVLTDAARSGGRAWRRAPRTRASV